MPNTAFFHLREIPQKIVDGIRHLMSHIEDEGKYYHLLSQFYHKPCFIVGQYPNLFLILAFSSTCKYRRLVPL